MASLLAAVQLGASAGTARAEVVELVPDDRLAWTPGQLFSVFRPGFHSKREVEVETTPPGAALDLYYVRAGFQKRYEQAEAPVTIVLPKRAQAGSRDTVTIRASADGFRAQETTFRVHGRDTSVLIELDPLPNTLEAVVHTYFAGRATIAFMTKEPITPSVRERGGDVQLALDETAQGPEVVDTIASIRNPLLASIDTQQLGEDLVVRLALVDPEAVELRSRQWQDPVRDLHAWSVDLVPADGGAEAIARARAALAAIAPGEVAGCALVFDDALRQALDAAELSRALVPSGRFVDPYLRAAMRRLGELSPDRTIRMTHGARYRPDVPLELAAAMSEASKARGLLALLRQFSQRLESGDQADAALQALIAPELEATAFRRQLADATALERSCQER